MILDAEYVNDFNCKIMGGCCAGYETHEVKNFDARGSEAIPRLASSHVITVERET